VKQNQGFSAYDHTAPPGWQAILERSLDELRWEGGIGIDLGCGPGAFSATLAHVTGTHVIGIDRNMTSICRANHLQEENSTLSLVCAEASRLPIATHSVDVVMLRYLLHHASDWKSILRETVRILKTNGSIIIETRDPEVLATSLLYAIDAEYSNKDLNRWPTFAAIFSCLEGLGMTLRKLNTFKIERAVVSRDEAERRAEHWLRYGGGTSFWANIPPPKRLPFFRHRMAQFPQDRSKPVPIWSEGVMISYKVV
jgi:SAM-dependent methyltransferase